MTLNEIFFSYNGRLNRRPYILSNLCIYIPSAIFQYAVLGRSSIIVSTLVLWPAGALATKRAHDRGHSSGWVLSLFWIPSILMLVMRLPISAVKLSDMMQGAVLWLLLIPLMWVSIELLFFRGQNGSNDFGPDPL